MSDGYIKLFIYIGSLLFCGYSLEALNMEKFIKKNRIQQAYFLHFILLVCSAYLLSSFLMAIKDIIL